MKKGNIFFTSLYGIIIGVVISLIYCIAIYIYTALKSALLNAEFSAHVSVTEVIIAVGIPFVCYGVALLITLISSILGRKAPVPSWWDKDNTGRSKDKRTAMDPPVPAEYLSRKPDGFTFGRHNGRYTRLMIDTHNIMHVLIIGSPGSWKSTTLENELLWNFNFASENQRATIFAFDIKPELQRHTVNYDPYAENTDVKVIDPSNTSPAYWGFDVYYGLNASSSDDDVEKRMDIIARTLIVSDGAGENAIFYQTAQNLLIGFLLYGYFQGKPFIDSMLQLMSVPLKDLLAEIMADKNMLQKHPKLRLILQPYAGKEEEGDKLVMDAESTMRAELRIFGNRSVQYCFRDNPRKATPEDLRNGISIFLALPDNLLAQYRAIFRMITELTINYLSSVPERIREHESPILLIIDEAGSIGHLQIEEPLARLRSRNCSIWLCIQGLSQLDAIYKPTGRRSIMTNCEVTLLLSSRDDITNKYFSELAGQYRETKISTHRNGLTGINSKTSEQVSYEYRNIYDPSDIAKLRAEKKLIAFVDGSFFYVDKSPFFLIPEYKKLVNEITEQNDNAMQDYQYDTVPIPTINSDETDKNDQKEKK